MSSEQYADTMRALFRLDGAARRHPEVCLWLEAHQGPLGDIARYWFDAIRRCGDDVEEVMHDGHPTACVGGAAFAYVGVFRSHVTIGFFQGAELPDPDGLLLGSGRYMRHLKIRPGEPGDERALSVLAGAAYAELKARLLVE